VKIYVAGVAVVYVQMNIEIGVCGGASQILVRHVRMRAVIVRITMQVTVNRVVVTGSVRVNLIRVRTVGVILIAVVGMIPMAAVDMVDVRSIHVIVVRRRLILVVVIAMAHIPVIPVLRFMLIDMVDVPRAGIVAMIGVALDVDMVSEVAVSVAMIAVVAVAIDMHRV